MLLVAAGVLAAVALARFAFLLAYRRPVATRAVDHDYGEYERLMDRDLRLPARVDNVPTSADIPFRSTATRVAYEVAGAEYRADVSLLTFKGERAETMPVVWYDPAHPERISPGPGRTVLPALYVAVMLIVASFVIG